MEQECRLTNRDWNENNTRVTKIEDSFEFIKVSLCKIETKFDEIDKKFSEYRFDRGDDVNRMGGRLEKQIDQIDDTLSGRIDQLADRVDKYKWIFYGGWGVLATLLGLFVWIVDHFGIFQLIK